MAGELDRVSRGRVMMASTLRVLGWLRAVWQGEPHASDLPMQGEHRVARARVLLVGTLTVLGVAMVAADPGHPEYRRWVPYNVACLVLAVAALAATRRGRRPRGLGLLTSIADVSVVSLLHVFDLVDGRPSAAVNGRVTFLGYFLALLGTCVRWDFRVPLVAGLVAAVEYGVIVVQARAIWPEIPTEDVLTFGRFDAGVQVERIVTLLLFAGACASIARWSLQWRAHATHDGLTGLLNRRSFTERLHEELLRARRSRQPTSVAMIDVDHFKRVNDTFGHPAGDVALRNIAQFIRHAVRQTDAVARWGGEEFAIVFADTAHADAFANVERLRKRLQDQSIPLDGVPDLHLTISGGVATSPQDGTDVDTLTNSADLRLLEAKRAGRNRTVSAAEMDG